MEQQKNPQLKIALAQKRLMLLFAGWQKQIKKPNGAHQYIINELYRTHIFLKRLNEFYYKFIRLQKNQKTREKCQQYKNLIENDRNKVPDKIRTIALVSYDNLLHQLTTTQIYLKIIQQHKQKALKWVDKFINISNTLDPKYLKQVTTLKQIFQNITFTQDIIKGYQLDLQQTQMLIHNIYKKYKNDTQLLTLFIQDTQKVLSKTIQQIEKIK